MNEFLKTLGWFLILRAAAPFIFPAIVILLVGKYWSSILIYGGAAFLVSFAAAWWTIRRDRKKTARYYAEERARLATLGLPQKMCQLTGK